MALIAPYTLTDEVRAGAFIGLRYVDFIQRSVQKKTKTNSQPTAIRLRLLLCGEILLNCAEQCQQKIYERSENYL